VIINDILIWQKLNQTNFHYMKKSFNSIKIDPANLMMLLQLRPQRKGIDLKFECRQENSDVNGDSIRVSNAI
jgi:hypothetical protein